MILFVEAAARKLTINESSYRWAQIKQMIRLDNVVGAYLRTVVVPLRSISSWALHSPRITSPTVALK